MLALDVLEAFQKAADVEQQAGKFRADRVERLVHALARVGHRVGRVQPRRAPPDDIGLYQLVVVRGIRSATVKSRRSRSPA